MAIVAATAMVWLEVRTEKPRRWPSKGTASLNTQLLHLAKAFAHVPAVVSATLSNHTARESSEIDH